MAAGYGYEHVKLRRRWKRLVEGGGAYCARCGGLIERGQAWDLDHSDDREGYIGVSHARCNRRAGGQRGGRTQARKAQRRAWSREWV